MLLREGHTGSIGFDDRDLRDSQAATRGIRRIHRLRREGFVGFTGCDERDSQDHRRGGAVTRGIHRIIGGEGL